MVSLAAVARLLYHIISPHVSSCRDRLFDLFGQIEKEFETLYASNLLCKYDVL